MGKSRINPFQRIARCLTSGKVLILTSVAVLVAGLLWILFPIIDGASEIFFPGSTSYVIELFLAATAVVLFHITCFVLAVFYRRSVKYVIYMLIPAAPLAAVNHLLYPPGITRIDRGIDSLELGARYRVRWAGGAEKVRREALVLLGPPSQVSPLRSDWPDSIRALRASRVKVDEEARLIDVEIPRRRFFFWSDQFGYLITDANAPEPVVVDDPPVVRGHRLWKIADGIYLYETWP